MLAARRLPAMVVGVSIALGCSLPAVGSPAGRARTEARLRSVRAAIAHAHARVRRDRAERVRLTRELRSAELSESASRTALQHVRGSLASVKAKRAKLAGERRNCRARMARDRAILAGSLRAAYLIGRDEPLKVLLNQRDPGRAGRMLAYYGYFGRARARLLKRIAAESMQLQTLEADLAGQERHLAALEAERREAFARFARARLRRSAALASLNEHARTQTERLRRLQRERAGLEDLLRRLRRAGARRVGGTAFARLRGRLAWPVAGRLAERFGAPRGGGLKWEGDLIDTVRGAPVRAVSAGRVIFANWLPGLGLLIIIDHGGGYLSLYGHNERLYKKVGDEVTAGAVIAAAGASGGSARPELYFGIRKGDRPIDPRTWFTKRAPSP